MKPLNKKERTNLLMKFAGIFILGVLIILIPFYFILRLPGIESGMQSEELRKLEEILKIQKEYYASKIESLETLFSKFNLPNEDLDKLNADIGFILSDIEHKIGADTTWRAKMNRRILNTYLDLKKTKNDHYNLNSELVDCNKELEKCGKDLKEAKESGKPKDSLDN